jgi:hypothetical protein
MQTICVDEQHFPSLRARNGVYVDKTKNIYDVFSSGKYFFIARPRRFGKSLLCSTIAALFEGNKAAFTGLWIESSDWNWENYPVIQLDLTLAASPAADAARVRDGIMLTLKHNAQRLLINDIKEEVPALFFNALIKSLYQKTGKQVVVIVDEYDKPLLDVLHHPERYPAIHDELRGLYAQLKGNSEHLRFVFLTGVFKFAQTSVFSGLNNIIDLTFNAQAAELLGYTQEEILTYFPEHFKTLAAGYKKTASEMLEILKEQYNGYTFGIDDMAEKVVGSVYNPFAINHVFFQQALTEEWFTSATPTALITKLKQMNFEEIDPSHLNVSLRTLKTSCEPDKITAQVLLYYAGYTTIKNYDREFKLVSLDFPNAEVAQSFSRHLLPLVTEKNATAILNLAQKLKLILLQNRFEELMPTLNQALAQLPYHLFGTQESYYQTVFYLLFNAGTAVTIAEDMMNRGRADITVLLSKSIFIFELKMNQSAAIAIAQIKEKNYASKYLHLGRKIYAVGINLSSKDRVVEELVYQPLND